MKPTLLIMAAGVGSRYGSLKQVDGLGPSGEYMLDYAVYDALKAGFGKVVFVIRKRIAQEMQERFAHLKGKIDIDFVVQEVDILPEGIPVVPDRTKPWGTGHAVWVAAKAIKEPFAVINADDFYGREAFIALGIFLASVKDLKSHTYAMVGYRLDRTLSDFGAVSRGICAVDGAGLLRSVTEQTHIEQVAGGLIYQEHDGSVGGLHGDEIASMNMWGFTPAVFAELENSFRHFYQEHKDEPKSEFYLPMVIGELITQEKATVKVLHSDAEWFGVTYQGDKPGVMGKLEALVDTGKYPSPLFEGM